jgi:cell division protease FtsH
MSEKLGNVAYERQRASLLGTPAMEPWAERSFSEATAREIDGAVRTLIDQALATATGILQLRRRTLEAEAQALLQHETLSEAELSAIVDPPLRQAALSSIQG